MRLSRFLFPVLILLGSVLPAATTAPASRPAMASESQRHEVSELSRQAFDLIDLHRFSDAEQTLMRALELMPDNATCLFNLACVHAAMRRPRAALDDLNRATEAGFTDFSHLESDPVFSEVRDLPGYQELLGRKDQITHAAGLRIIAELKQTLGEKYLYEADEKRKFVFAARASRPQLDALEKALNDQTATLEGLVFSHPSDEFIRIELATPVDFAKLEKQPGVEGYYNDATRTLLVRRMGAELRHEFTHALHAADQHALGQAHPVWLSEGLATLFEYPRTERGEADQDNRLLPNDTWRLAVVQTAARTNGLIPLDKLVVLNREAFTERANLTYGEAGSLLMYLYEHQQLKAFYTAYTDGYPEDASGRAALEKVTGLKMDQLQAKWVAYLMPRAVPARREPGAVR